MSEPSAIEAASKRLALALDALAAAVERRHKADRDEETLAAQLHALGADRSRLAAELDTRIARLRARFGEIGDTRLTVMAALTVADELAETKAKLQRMEPELAGLQDANAVSADHAQATHAAVVAALNAAAERIEGI